MKTNTVIIIDDNQMAVQALVKTTDWERLGCQVVGTASDGYEGLEKIREFRPDLVVTDIRMPGYNGLELIRLLTQQGYPGKFIIITGYEEFEYARKAIQYGVSDFLTKPVSAEDLEKVSKRYGSGRKKSRYFPMKKRRRTVSSGSFWILETGRAVILPLYVLRWNISMKICIVSCLWA